MRAFFDALAANEFPYRPLLTNRYVVDELVSLLLAHAGHAAAATALRTLLDSTALTVVPVDDGAFERAADAFFQYDDQAISLTDHVVAIQAASNGASHVLAYVDDFRTLGFTVVPRAETG